MVKAAAAQRHEKSMNLLASDVGRRIRAARLERGMSLAQLGADDLSRSFLSLVELGRSRISLQALAIVAERLQLPISSFLDDSAMSSEGAIELVLDEAEAYLRQNKVEKALSTLTDLQLTPGLRARGLWLRGWALASQSRDHEATTALQEALPLAQRDGHTRLTVQIQYTLAMALYHAGALNEALSYVRGALDLAIQSGQDEALIGRITIGIGHILYLRGEIDQAMAHYARARQLFDSINDLDNIAAVYSGLSLGYKHRGDVSSALRYSRLALGIYELKHSQWQAARELNNIALRYEELGRLDEALDSAREAVIRAQDGTAVDLEAVAHSTLASIYLRREEYERAAAEAEQAMALGANDHDLGRIDAWIVLAKLAEHRGDHAKSDSLFKRALEVLQESAQLTSYADTALTYSLALRARGQMETALDYALLAAQAKFTLPA